MFNFRKIHPQFGLGIILGLSVTFMLHSHRSIEVTHALIKRVSHLADQQSALRNSINERSDKSTIYKDFPSNESDPIHEYLDNNPDDTGEHEFKDSHHHHDDDSTAKALFKQVRVLCWVMTSPTTLHKKAIHVRNTWGSRCNVLLFMSSEEDKEFPAVGLNVTEGRKHLTAKTMQAFSYVYDRHLNDADWFLKADDDTYVIMENLRYFLSNEDPYKAIYFGHRFKPFVKQGYASGGAGYVLSKEALKRFGETGRKDSNKCATDTGPEDVQMGKCLSNLEVVLKPSLDAMGRSRFHCLNPDGMINKHIPKWLLQFDVEGVNGGIENISDYAITFHYVSPGNMYNLEFFTYHLQPYGIISRPQDLNVKP